MGRFGVIKMELVTGGAGFIGSHLVDSLVSKGLKVRVLDNFSSGRKEFLEHHAGTNNVEVVIADLLDLDAVKKSHDWDKYSTPSGCKSRY